MQNHIASGIVWLLQNDVAASEVPGCLCRGVESVEVGQFIFEVGESAECLADRG